MVERVVERGREPEPQENLYDFNYRFRQNWLRQRLNGAIILKGKEIAWEQSRQGLIKYYCHPKFWTEQSVPGWSVFIHKIQKHSGKHIHQGGLGLLVLEGKGYTVVDGIRYDWEKDDLILLPVKPNGCEHQHFNADPSGKAAEWMAFIFNPYFEALGAPLEQKAESPDWKGTTPPLRHVA